mgnify:CR=1 FL=1|jgi:hypothetical protein
MPDPKDLHNVFENPRIARLDPTDHTEACRDTALIRTYIRAAKEVAAASRRTPPSIGRTVLTSIWETPRIRFHLEAKKSFSKKAMFRTKLLWVPWSIEAQNRWNDTHDTKDLRVEHVTPIDWMWRNLIKLHDEFEDPTSAYHPNFEWENEAALYLNKVWMVTVLTKEQAAAIDAIKGLRSKGFDPNPFERYRLAENEMNRVRDSGTANPPPPFSVANFIIAGGSG